MRNALVALLFLASPALAQDAPPQEGPISCAMPAAASDSASSLKQRYGKEAVVQDLPGAEGETSKGLVLFPKATDRRIEVAFFDEKMKRVSGLTLRETAKTSRWSIAGVSIGSSLADVQKANGKSFLVAGFEWDYGGFVTDWKSGALAKPMAGGCNVIVRFGKDAGAPRSLSGDGVKAASDSAAMLKFAPVVTEIGIGFPEK